MKVERIDLFRSRQVKELMKNAYIQMLLDSGRKIDMTRAQSYKEGLVFIRRIADEVDGVKVEMVKAGKIIQGITEEAFIVYDGKKIATITPRIHSLNGYIIWDRKLTKDGSIDNQHYVGRNYDEIEQDRTLHAIQIACNNLDEIANVRG